MMRKITIKQSRYLFRLGLGLLILAMFLPQWWLWVPATVAGAVMVFLGATASHRAEERRLRELCVDLAKRHYRIKDE